MSEPQTPTEKPRLLWANHACLLDTTSGAAMSARQMLLCLQARGYEIQILGTTQFDAPQGVAGLGSAWAEVKKNRGKTVKLVDGPLQHQLLVTGGTQRKDTTFHEMAQWHHLLRLPSSLHQAPYNKLPDQNTLNRICDLIARHFDDAAWYTTLCEQAHIVGRQRHSMDASTQRLLVALNQLIASPTA
jgi:hypothetical protein